MMASDFISRFHNLEGDSIPERKKNFNLLLKHGGLYLSEEEVNVMLEDLRPKTYLEGLLRMDILIRFKKTEKLLDILKEGNEVFVSKIIKQPWFFKEALKNVSAERWVDEFLPCTSFALRMKVLKRVSVILNENEMDEIFDGVQKRYGIYLATKILASCSAGKIREVMSHYEIELKPSQVKAICNKDVELFKEYLKYHRRRTGAYYDNRNVFDYIASKNLKFWLDLQMDNVCTPTYARIHKAGRRTSKTIMKVVPVNEIGEEFSKYKDILRRDVLVRKLGRIFTPIYLDMFPRKMKDINEYNFCIKLLRYWPKKRRWELFSRTFSQIFDNENIVDHLSCLDQYLIKMCPDRDIIRKWAEEKYKETDAHYLLKFLEPKKAIPLIKDKINVTSDITERFRFVELLLDNCAENKDLSSLESVLQYICFRHRNEDSSFHYKILNAIKNKFDLKELRENHWKYINEEIDLRRVNEDFRYYEVSGLIEKYLEYLFLNGKPFKNEIIQLINDFDTQNVTMSIYLKDLQVKKEILIQIGNFIPEVIRPSHKNYHLRQSQLIKCLIDFSTDFPEYCIDLLHWPTLMTFIMSIFNKTEFSGTKDYDIIAKVLLYNLTFPDKAVPVENNKIFTIFTAAYNDHYSYIFLDVVEKMITKKERTDFENDILNFCFDTVINQSISLSTVSWFLANEPTTLASYFNKIVHKSLEYKYFDCHSIKLYSHLGFDSSAIEFYKTQLQDGSASNRKEAFINLSLLLPTEELIDITHNYVPKKVKLDLQDEEMTALFNLQCEVAKNLKKVTEPVKLVPVVMEFCIGDYLQSSLTSLYSLFYRCPEKLLYQYMEILAKRAVSVRKHALFLSCELLNFNYVVNLLKTSQGGNVPSQKHIFIATMKYFRKNPSEELLDLLISSMCTIDQNDSETLNSLVNVKVPEKYKPVYLQKCWEFFEDLKEVKIKKYLEHILAFICQSKDLILSLNREFCKKLIVSYFQDRNEDLNNIDDFICNVLRYREAEQRNNFALIFEIISTFKVNRKTNWIKNFFSKCNRAASEEKVMNNYTDLFTKHWLGLFLPLEMFKQYIQLKLLNLKHESVQPFIENYAKNVVLFLEQLTVEYGPLVLNKLKELLPQALNFDAVYDKYLFFYHILKFKITPANCILVLDTMRKVDDYSTEDVRSIYNDILEILKNVKDPIVIIYYDAYVN